MENGVQQKPGQPNALSMFLVTIVSASRNTAAQGGEGRFRTSAEVYLSTTSVQQKPRDLRALSMLRVTIVSASRNTTAQGPCMTLRNVQTPVCQILMNEDVLPRSSQKPRPCCASQWCPYPGTPLRKKNSRLVCRQCG